MALASKTFEEFAEKMHESFEQANRLQENAAGTIFAPHAGTIPSLVGSVDCRGDYSSHLVKIKRILDFKEKGVYEILLKLTLKLMREKNVQIARAFSFSKDFLEALTTSIKQQKIEKHNPSRHVHWAARMP